MNCCLALKGFDAPADAEPSLAAARSRGLDPGHIHLPDDGMDLTAYARVVSAVPADRYCFTNSFSRAVADGWLGHLSAALDQPGVGLGGSDGLVGQPSGLPPLSAAPAQRL